MSKEETLPAKTSNRETALPAIVQSSVSLIPLGIGAVGSVCLYVFHFHILGMLVGLFALGGLAYRRILRVTSHRVVTAVDSGPPDRSIYKELRKSLSKAQYLENVDSDIAERALGQFDQILDRRCKFIKSLELRFEQSELAFDRYMSAAELVCTVALDNLKAVAVNLDSLSAMNLKQLKCELDKNKGSTNPMTEEAQVMGERLKMGMKLEADTVALLANTETAITGFDRVILAVSEIKTSKSGGANDLDSVMQELQELALRAKKYTL